MNPISRIGMDTAKNVFQLHGVDNAKNPFYAANFGDAR